MHLEVVGSRVYPNGQELRVPAEQVPRGVLDPDEDKRERREQLEDEPRVDAPRAEFHEPDDADDDADDADDAADKSHGSSIADVS